MSPLKPSKREQKRAMRKAHNAAIRNSIEKDFGPIVKKISAPVEGAAKKHPKRTFVIMMVIIIINIVLLFSFTDDLNFNNNETDFKLSEVIPKFNDTPLPQNKGGEFSLGNFLEILKIRDSIKYLMVKRHLSGQDSLLFIRLSERMAQIDKGYHPIYNPK